MSSLRKGLRDRPLNAGEPEVGGSLERLMEAACVRREPVAWEKPGGGAELDSRYAMPRAPRFTAPNILHVLLCEGLGPALERWVRSAPRATPWGGERDNVLAIDRQGRRVVHQDIVSRVHRMERALFDHVGLGQVLLGHAVR